MRKYFLSICLLMVQMATYAQADTLKLDLKTAEKLFITHNYQLLASNYQIDQAKAEVITAKLFDNPEISYENLFYNPETKRFLETSYATGQYAAQISQLFKLAGKRKKSIVLAQTGVKLAEQDYAETLRNLRYQLRSTFYRAYFKSQSTKVFQQEINSSNALLKNYQQQQRLGNVAQKDVIRIQSLVINLNAEYNELLNDLEDDFKDLKLICGIRADQQLIIMVEVKTEKAVDQLAYTALLDSAKANRADYKAAKTTLQLNEANLKLQKAMAIPDVSLSLSYDLKGNYPEKYTGIGISMPLPFFNRNQGEIKKAKIGIDAAATNVNMVESLLANEVYNSYKTAVRSAQQLAAIDAKFANNFEQLMTSINKNFNERNLSLIEFLDLYTSYKESMIKLNALKLEVANTREEINYVTGSSIFK